MQIDKIFNKIKKEPLGSKYFKADLHLHYDPPEEIDKMKYCNDLFKVLVKHGIQIVGLTVHRQKDLKELLESIEYFYELNEKMETDIIFFPSIEVKDSSNTHFSIIFDSDPNLSDTEIGNLLGAIGRKNDQNNEDNRDQGDLLNKSLSGNKREIEKIFSDYSVIGFFPHPLDEDGIASEMEGETLKDYARNPLTSLWNLGQPKIKGNNLEVSNNCPKKFTKTPRKFHDIKELNRIAKIKVSDAHDPDLLNEIYDNCPSCRLYNYCNVGTSFLKLSERNITGLKQIEYDFNTRVKFNLDNVREQPIIMGFYVEGEFFQETFFRFNPELNVLIGGRGTGKSLIIDLIRFGLNSITQDEDCLAIFNNKIIEQLGNEGKVIIFLKESEGNIVAIKNTLLIQEETKKINWKNNVLRKFYKKHGNNPFYKMEGENSFQFQLEALSQTEIPRLHKKTSSLLNIIDTYIRNFPEKRERLNLIRKMDEIKNKLLEKYKEYDNLDEDVTELNTIKNRIKDISEHVDKLEGINYEEYQSVLSMDEKIKNRKNKIDEWLNNLKSDLGLKYKGDLFLEKDSDLLEGFNVLTDLNSLYNSFLDFQERLKDILEHKMQTINTKYDEIIKDWNNFYSKINEKYEKLLEEHNVDYLSELQKEIAKLERKKKNLHDKLKKYRNIKQEARIFEVKLFKLGKSLVKETRNIRDKRNKTINKIEEKLNKFNINVKMGLTVEPKRVKESRFFDWLKRFHEGKEEVLKIIHEKFSPFKLGKIIINNESNKLNNRIPGKYYRIIQKLENLVQNKNTPKYFDKSLIDLLKIYVDSRPKISYMREGLERHHQLNRLSIGERCAILLYIMLLEEEIPFLVDQADSELDQESIRKFSKFILEIKNNRQIIVATHNPNLPTLGDADLLYHLKTQPKEDREIGKISKKGGFESCIESILMLEGGRTAIKRRFKKYDEKFLI